MPDDQMNPPAPGDEGEGRRLPEQSSRSQEVLRTLAEQEGRAARFYEGALRALADRANPVRVEMAAYALRELIEELERQTVGVRKGPKLGDLLKKLRGDWTAAPRRPTDRGLLDDCDPAIFAVDRFLEDVKVGHRRRRDRAQQALGGIDPVGRPNPPDTEIARTMELLRFRERFNDVLHGPESTEVAAFDALLEGFETFLLAILRPRTFEDLSEIDEFLEEGPPEVSGSRRAELVTLVRANTANLDYFFSRLDDASWLPFLLEEGFFRHPTPPETGSNDDGQTWFRYPNWPESRYLARIAAEAPEKVAAAVECVPEAANPRVHEDVIVAATAMPGGLAAKIAKREARWLARHQGHLLSLPRPAGELLVHLAEEGEMKAAFALAGTLLKIEVDPSYEDRTSRRRAVARVGDREYSEILKAAWPAMMSAEPDRAFSFLCHHLADVVALGFVEDSGFDRTYMWRSAIEDHAQNTGGSLLDTMVEAVRDTAVAQARKDPEERHLILAELARHEAVIFRRIALFIIAGFGTPREVADALVDEAALKGVDAFHEYAELLRARFGDLEPYEQASLMAMIGAGPGEDLGEFQRERGDSEERIAAYGRHWRLRRYDLIAGHLEGEALREYRSLLEEFDRPDHPTFLSVVTHWSGHESPYTAEQLAEMSPSAVADAVRAAAEEVDEDSGSGLALVLESAVEKDPRGYASVAERFADLEVRYIRALLGGLGKEAREKRSFDWGPVLELAEKVTVDRRAGPSAGEEGAALNWLHRTIVSLLSDGMKKGDAELPIEERERIWTLIEPLLDHPDPSPERDEGGEPSTLAINSVRGEALHAVVDYAFWVERAQEADGSFEGIRSLPEFGAAVERRLDPAIESSSAILAVLGEWFVQFVRMDEAWASGLAPKVFPSGPDAARRFSAAWNGYVVFNQAWTSTFEILRECYELAVERSEQVDEGRYMAGNPQEHLGRHLNFLRFSGSIDLADDGIFARFWSTAPTEIRKRLIRDVGWSLEHGNRGLSENVGGRIVETWEWIAEQTKVERSALSEFGAWLGARQLDDGWLLDQALRLLKDGIALDPDHVVYGGLPRMAATHPREVVEVLRLMIVTEPESWSVLGARDQVRETLAAALEAEDQTARKEALGVLNLLGARGMTEFRDLMPPRTEGDLGTGS
jgi:hypothetical protein